MRWLDALLGRRAAFEVVEEVREPRIVLADSCFQGLQACLTPARQRRHEGVAFLLGKTDGVETLALTAVRPNARTGPGFFHVSAPEMAKIVGLALELDLQIVGQVHTHPGDAYHSDGDEDGANIRFEGFVSIVFPDYGDLLPCFKGAAIYHYSNSRWETLAPDGLIVVQGGAALR